MKLLTGIKKLLLESKHKTIFLSSLVILLVAICAFSFSNIGRSFIDSVLYRTNTASVSALCKNYAVNIHFLNVGKADCMIIECDNEYAVLDGATYDRYDEIRSYLSALGVTKLSAVINSHPDKDHIGSLAKIIENFDVGEYIQSPIALSDNSAENQAVMNAVKSKNIPVSTMRSGDSFKVGSVTFDVLAPIKEYDDTNNMSLIIRAHKDNFSILFCGDMMGNELDDLLGSKLDLSADIIKISHHGSRSGTSDELLSAVSPKYAVISVGKNNSGLPDGKTIQQISDCGAELLQTSEDGNIIISADYSGKYIITKEE